MDGDTKVIKSYFASLGLKNEITDIYLALCAHGTQTISELSRNAGVERTRIYRMLEELKQTKLIIVEVHYKRELLRAAPITNLELLVNQKTHEAEGLKANLPTIYSLLADYQQQQQPTHVQFYKGDEGMKQMIWNETKAKGEVCCILHNDIQCRFGLNYFVSWARRCNKKNVRFRGIISDQFIEDQVEWYDTHQNERLEHWTQRYISPTVFPITYSTIIYDDTVGYYNWKDSREVFGIEIHSQEIADAQNKLFDLLWETTTPSKHILDKS